MGDGNELESRRWREVLQAPSVRPHLTQRILTIFLVRSSVLSARQPSCSEFQYFYVLLVLCKFLGRAKINGVWEVFLGSAGLWA